MEIEEKPPTTQRAYALRLQGNDRNDSSWRDPLWKTHEAVNKAAKAFGDWLLTLRGGIDHELANPAKAQSPDTAAPDREEQKARRILLALSWLSVESARGAPKTFVIATGQDEPANRNQKVLAALEETLRSRKLTETEIAEWKTDCNASLSAAIRDDAVWVNRSKAFDAAREKIGDSLTRAEVWDFLERFLGSSDSYLKNTESPTSKKETKDAPAAKKEKKAKDLAHDAGQWLSSRFGTGTGANYQQFVDVYKKIVEWAAGAPGDTSGVEAIKGLARALGLASTDLDAVLGPISGPGYKSATRNLLKKINGQVVVTKEDLENLGTVAKADQETSENKIGGKGRRSYSDAILNDVEEVCGIRFLQDQGRARQVEFAVILDHAARRVVVAHSWIKRAEAERQMFEEAASKADKIPSSIREWLNAFCAERSQRSGAVEPYRIRRRALNGWKEVVAAWEKLPNDSSREDRIAVVRELQDDPQIEKFGDAQLFEALAEDDARCVWHREADLSRTSDHQPLIDYALASDAEFKKQQFKVPAYRHPDALSHPVFCDFGNSRWKIAFAAHQERRTTKRRKGKQTEQQTNLRTVNLSLWNGTQLDDVPLRWQSKRLARDLALDQKPKTDKVIAVNRADRLGRAVSGAASADGVTIAGLFDEKHWNGRLQAPRAQLDAIAKVRDNTALSDSNREKQLAAMTAHIRWSLTVSPKLVKRGPWHDFVKTQQLKIGRQGGVHDPLNRGRGTSARLILSRLPGLRVLSVDLGHRHAAACAIWQTATAEEVRTECLAAHHKAPDANDLYVHLNRSAEKQKKGQQIAFTKTTVYRRIGADSLPDGTLHPAPWARLDRQFLIKVQGEDQPVREASNQELWAVHQMEAQLGRSTPLIDHLVNSGWGASENQQKRIQALKQLGWSAAEKAASRDESRERNEPDAYRPSLAVDELMSTMIHVARLALKRHAIRARIAHDFIADTKTRPGGVKERLDDAGHIELIQNALIHWYTLFTTRGWQDPAARKLWDTHIAAQQPCTLSQDADTDRSDTDRKKAQRKLEEALRPVAEKLAREPALRKTLHDAWKEQWQRDDNLWPQRLRQIKAWLLPRGKKADNPEIRMTGGLSLTRLATLTEFRRKVQVGFFTRLRPDGSVAETNEAFGQRTLNALEHLREQRVKQLASRIAEAALGIGRISRPTSGKDPKRLTLRVDEPCHAIVIENLTHYRPEQTRTRRENRQLMNWSSSKVKKHLAEACELHGLHLWEASASYTSRQDSRTGAPGTRCRDVQLNDFMKSPFWQKQVEQAKKALGKSAATAFQQHLCTLHERWKDKAPADWKKAGTIRLPATGGELFVSADPNSPAAKGLQADLNAAANIGLRALNDPDWPGAWWYVPCDATNYMPIADRVRGSAAIDENKALSTQKPDRQSKAKNRSIINLWCDVAASPLDSPQRGQWQDYKAYENSVLPRVLRILSTQAQQAAAAACKQHPEDDLPY